uniref:Uncharacterized protein n=1 Tax=Triticum urartu TaxID=4572 RepID=A0A8R7TN84_TRIUA
MHCAHRTPRCMPTCVRWQPRCQFPRPMRRIPRHTGDIGMGDEGRLRWLHGLPRPWCRQCRNMRASGG